MCQKLAQKKSVNTRGDNIWATTAPNAEELLDPRDNQEREFYCIAIGELSILNTAVLTGIAYVAHLDYLQI